MTDAAHHQAAPPAPAPRRALFVRPRTYLLAATVILVAAGGGLGLWMLRGGRSDVAGGMAALREAYRTRRAVEARVTDLEYAPLVVTRGREHTVANQQAREAERLLLDAVSARPDAEAHHALGRAYLLGGQFAQAAEHFGAALRLRPRGAQIHSDMGVALLEAGKREEQGGDEGKAFESYGRSLEHVNKAVLIEPDLPEALYNRALALQQQMAYGQAREAWLAYLARDAQSKWADEARRHLDLLSEHGAPPPTARQLLDDFTAAARSREDGRAWQLMSRNKEMVTGRFLPQQLAMSYLRANAEGRREESGEFLEALAYAGKLELERARDPYVSDVAAFYARTSAGQRALLGEAQAAVAAGYDLCQQPDFEKALEQFVRAKALFERAGDEWESRLCDYWIAYCYSQRDSIKQSTALLLSLAEYSRKRDYKWLYGQAACWVATNYAELGEHSNAIEYYNRALPVVEEIGDAYNTQKVVSQLASQYTQLGQPRRALAYNWRSLRLADSAHPGARQVWRNYLYTTRTLISMKLYDAAAAFGGEMLHVALSDIKKPDTIQYAYHYVAQLYGESGQYEEALRVNSESFGFAQSLVSEQARRKQGTYSLMQLAHLQRKAGRCAQARDTYEQVIRTYDQMELGAYRYDAHKGRLLCNVALKNDAEIEAELPVVLEQFNKYRKEIREEENRNTFFDREQGVYDIAINHAYAKGDGARAFAYSEDSRARSLLETLRGGAPAPEAEAANAAAAAASRPLSLPEMQERMPPDVQVLQYAVLEDKTLIWLVTKDSVRSAKSEIAAAELHNKIVAYVNALSRGPAGGRDDLRGLAVELYGALVGPVAGLLDPQKVVCVIPDKAVSLLPFSTLVSPESGRYLVSDLSVMYSPSLSVFIHCSDAAGGKAHADAETLLSVGNPSFDAADYPALPRLPAAAREARGVAKSYAAAREFTGPDAVREAIERELPNADVIHFAGHYVTDDRDPMSSRLVLAKGRGAGADDDGSYAARKLVGQKLPRAKLVVLSACQTGGGKYYNGEGVIGISRTFLGTGIPLVVASQWAVDSEATAELMLKFHRYRKAEGLSTVAALRRAQLDLLGGSDGLYRDPYYWAAFLPIGGRADF